MKVGRSFPCHGILEVILAFGTDGQKSMSIYMLISYVQVGR